MGLAAFNAMRRRQAEQEAAERAKLEQEQVEDVFVPDEEKEPENGENESQADFSAGACEDMDIES
jgi:hypothetical protein